jgi:hypothetical protein
MPTTGSMPLPTPGSRRRHAGRNTSARPPTPIINGLGGPEARSQFAAGHHAVAQQVEALFLQMMLKSMRDASAADDDRQQ